MSWRHEVKLTEIFLQISLMMALCAMPLLVIASPTDDLYLQALQLTKQGQYAKAIDLFERLVSQSPDNLNYRYDYILTLGWSDKNKQALQVSRKLDPSQTPSYVLEIIGKSARNEQDYELAEKMYRLALRKQPDRLQSQLGLAYVLLESGKTEESMSILSSLAERNPEHIGTLEALAANHQRNQEYLKALTFYQKILKLEPQHQGAKQGLVRITALLGAPHLAMEMIEKNPDLVNDNELSHIRQDRAAIEIRWGRLYHLPNKSHYEDTDAALKELQTLLERLNNKLSRIRQDRVALAIRWGRLRHPTNDLRYGATDVALKELQTLLERLNEDEELNSVLAHRIKTDMLLGLLDRHRTKECVVLYESLEEEKAVIANYGLMAAARAYQAEGQAAKARDIYLQILRNKPDSFEARLGLFYAYIDTLEYEQALALVNELSASEVEWTGGKDSPNRQENKDKVVADVAQALALAWTDNLSDAQRRFDELVSEAPFNAGLRSDRAYSYLWRGWPKEALQEFRLAHDIDSEDLTSAQGEFEALLASRNYQRTESALHDLVRNYPDERGVIRQQRNWFVHNEREFYMDVYGGNSYPGVQGSKNLKLDAWQYASPIDHNYRFFGHEVGEYGKFFEGSETYWRLGGGVEYRSPNWLALAELSSGPGDYSALGIGLATTWAPDDYWATTLAMNSYSNDIPLRGRLNEGVEGADVSLGVVYRFHELRTLSARVQAIDMSDGNERLNMTAGLFQRLKSTPDYKLDVNLDLYGSSNSRINAPYFNPESDLSVSILLMNEWLLSRNNKRDFLHRIGTGAGVYQQQGYGSDGLWSISYEHEWVVGDELVLRYGIFHASHPYDGIQESQNQLTLMMDMKF